MRFLFLSALLFLSACAAPAKFPTSEKLDLIREAKLPEIKQEVETAALIPGSPVFIRIFKEEGKLELWMREDTKTASGQITDGKIYRLYHTYAICMFSGELGPKLHEGDGQAPEGFYTVTQEQLNPWSKYHLSFDLGYPNTFDRAHGATGSLLMVHGGCRSEGCYAMTDPSMEEIYMLMEMALRGAESEGAGSHVPVHIFPFEMTPENIARHEGEKWMPFWKHLKPGYDAFEASHIPPFIVKNNGRYMVAQAFGGI